MTIDWKLVSYLTTFAAGIEQGREHHWLSIALLGGAAVSYWYIKHGTLSPERKEGEAKHDAQNEAKVR